MPRLYLMLRFEADNETRSSCRTTDITITGLPAALEADRLRTVKTYMVIDDHDPSGPWTYRVAFEIINMDGKDMHVVYSTVSRDDTLRQLKKILGYIREGDEERIENDNIRNRDPDDDIYDIRDSNDKAGVE
jgi:hypothetical protein